MVNKAFKTELDPTEAQKVLLAKHAGCARFVYNWALALLQEDYKTEKKLKPNAFDLSKELNKIK